MTRLELRNISRKALGETTAAFWSDAEINTYINLGCKDLAYRLKCLKATGYLSSISCESSDVSLKSNEYQLSDTFPNLLSVLEVYFKVDGQRFIRLESTSREELDVIVPGWQSLTGYTVTVTSGSAAVSTYNTNSQTGTPIKYYWYGEEDVLGLYPPPNDAQAGTNYIKIYYSYEHPDMGSDTATPSLPQPIHLAIVDFVAARGFEDRGWGDRANDVWAKYFKKISDFTVESGREKEDEEIIMKPYRNVY